MSTPNRPSEFSPDLFWRRCDNKHVGGKGVGDRFLEDKGRLGLQGPVLSSLVWCMIPIYKECKKAHFAWAIMPRAVWSSCSCEELQTPPPPPRRGAGGGGPGLRVRRLLTVFEIREGETFSS
jgi:hypothetical protein